MRLIFFIILACLSKILQSQTENGQLAVDKKQKSEVTEALATFAEGCFWHSEIVFQSLVGVRDAVSGYSGGKEKRPDYEKVSTGSTGHAECVQIYYDPAKITFKTLVSAFFASHDPTTVNRQGNDVGSQYRSIAFYRNEEEKKIILAEISHLTEIKTFKAKIVTEVKPFTEFYIAEKYHQEYVSKNPNDAYVKNVSTPEFLNFKKKFKEGNFKGS